jgi:hypothetical protein
MFILTVVWANRSHKAAQRLNPGPRAWSSGWTVGGWFIPVANLVIPWLVMRETGRIAAAPRTAGQVSTRWPSTRSNPLLAIWWAGLVAFVLVLGIAGGFYAAFEPSIGTNGTVPNRYDTNAGNTAYVLYAVAYFVGAIGLVAGAFYVR